MAAVIPAVTRISTRIIRILGCNPGILTLQGTNTYIVGTGKRRVLIDCGESDVPQYINHLRSVLEYENIDLAHILLTHWHEDHMGGLADILDELHEKTKHCQIWKFPNENDIIPKHAEIEPLYHGQEISVEGATLKVMHTPGHTDDHLSFYLVEENAIFSGDCVLGEGTAIFENFPSYLSSLDSILDVHPTVVYPGHGNVVHNPVERINYYIQHRLEREQQIVEVLSRNRKVSFGEEDLVKMVYQDIPEKLVKAAECNVTSHLNKLLREEKVIRNNNLWQFNEIRSAC